MCYKTASTLFGLTLCIIIISLVSCQEYVVPVYVRADQFGTDHFKLPEPKTGPTKSRFHMEQLIKLESELIGLGEIILETEAKLHAKQKTHEKEEKAKGDGLQKDKVKAHTHNYTRETKYIERISESNEEAMKDIKKWVSNPLAMFPIRKRLSEDWPYVLDNITECTMVANYDAIYDHFQHVSQRLTQDGDLKMAYEDILRLQKTYKLPVSSLARGWILDEIAQPLSLTDIINIAHICLDREDMEGTLEWLLQVAKFLKSMGLQGEDKVKYMNILGGAYLRLNRLQEAKLVYGQLLKEDPKSRIATANMQLITERMKEEAKKEQKAKEEAEKDSKKKTKTPTNKYGKKNTINKDDVKKENAYKEEWWMKYCRGDVEPDWHRDSLLKCYVKHIPISGIRYNIEPISIYPPIYIIKNVLKNFTMSMMVNTASKQLSERINSYSDAAEPSVPVFESDENYWMNSFSYTMKNLTYQDYQVDSHDQYNLLGAVRVYNVGAGGTSNPGRGEMRIDPNQGWERNYIGRYMMFLTAPKAGGHFSFPWAKVRVTPERGDVLFWQFRTPWGRVHPFSYHWLECPVLLGDFWYAEQMVEHHGMINQVNFEFNPNQFYIPEDLLKPKKTTKKVVKKKTVKKVQDEEAEEEEDEEEVPKTVPKKKMVKTIKKKVVKKTGDKTDKEEETLDEDTKPKTKKKVAPKKVKEVEDADDDQKSSKKNKVAAEEEVDSNKDDTQDGEGEAKKVVKKKLVKKIVKKKKIAKK